MPKWMRVKRYVERSEIEQGVRREKVRRLSPEGEKRWNVMMERSPVAEEEEAICDQWA